MAPANRTPWAEQPITLTGRQLGTVGLVAPAFFLARLVPPELTPPMVE